MPPHSPISTQLEQSCPRPGPTHKSKTRCKHCGVDPASSPLWPQSHSLRRDSSYRQDLKDEYRGYIVYSRWKKADKAKQKLRRTKKKEAKRESKERQKAAERKEKVESNSERARTKALLEVAKARKKRAPRKQEKEKQTPEHEKQKAASDVTAASTPSTKSIPTTTTDNDRITQGPEA
jgi:hypothetical protein